MQERKVSVADQYREAFQTRRHLDILLWQIPAVAVTVNGAVLVSILGVKPWIARELILFVSLVFTFMLLYATMAHRHWGDILRNSLTKMEDDSGLQRLHWGGGIKQEEKSKYWYAQDNPPWWYRIRAQRVSLAVMAIMILLTILLLITNPTGCLDLGARFPGCLPFVE